MRVADALVRWRRQSQARRGLVAANSKSIPDIEQQVFGTTAGMPPETQAGRRAGSRARADQESRSCFLGQSWDPTRDEFVTAHIL
eukprot:235684-Rhodomonas_salina.1